LLLEAKHGTSFTATDPKISLSQRFYFTAYQFLLGAKGFVVVKFYASFHEFRIA
jgi:hypothetical protein